jgi:hypothetical protein
MKPRCTRMLDRLRHNSPDRRLAVARLMAMAFVIFALLSFNSAHATITKSDHVKQTHIKQTKSDHVKQTESALSRHKNSAHTKHTKNSNNLTINSNNLINNGTNLINNGTNLIYDSALNITWYYDPNLGAVNWNDAMKWAENLAIGDVTDWRLPTTLPTYGYNVLGSELGHLYYDALGNSADIYDTSPIITGPFSNLRSVNYWSSTIDPKWFGIPGKAFVFNFSNGYQGAAFMNLDIGYSAIAVHSGNVGATQIPEPGVIFLFALGLVGIVVMRKKIIESHDYLS